MNIELIFKLLLENWQIVVFFFLIAVSYSSVGFGGGSSYLAVLALTSFAFVEIRATALLCNILVVSGNVFIFQQQKKHDYKKILPLILFSIPCAFLGGLIRISETFFFIILGFTLLFAAFTMWISKKIVSEENKEEIINYKKSSFFGGIIGFLSGLVGIGGGIFLAPLLHLTNWDTPKKIAATASLFILVNSIAGLVGQYSNPDFYINWNITSILLFVVLIGGILGNLLRNKIFNPLLLKRTTAFLIAIISLRILLKHLF